jgi:hypothetical protein
MRNTFNYFDQMGGEEFAPLAAKPETEKPEGEDDGIFEAAGDGAPADDVQVRSMGMTAVLSWVADGDFTYQDLDEYVIGMADLDGDEEIADEEEEVYNDIWQSVADAMLSLGADDDNVTEFIDDEDDDAGEKLGTFLSDVLDSITSEDEGIINLFAIGKEGAIFESAEPEEGSVFEAAYKKVRVVRNGKVKFRKKRVSGKVRLSAAQKRGLKKARRKANTSAAKLRRKKSNRRRKSRGM